MFSSTVRSSLRRKVMTSDFIAGNEDLKSVVRDYMSCQLISAKRGEIGTNKFVFAACKLSWISHTRNNLLLITI